MELFGLKFGIWPYRSSCYSIDFGVKTTVKLELPSYLAHVPFPCPWNLAYSHNYYLNGKIAIIDPDDLSGIRLFQKVVLQNAERISTWIQKHS
jgi:hypothetical protein